MTFAVSSQVDKLEECEAARLEEKKEEEYKPVVMGKLKLVIVMFLKNSFRIPSKKKEENCV